MKKEGRSKTWSFLQDIIKYTLVGDAAAREFFYINPTTGEVSIKKPLSEGSAATYTVSVNISNIKAQSHRTRFGIRL